MKRIFVLLIAIITTLNICSCAINTGDSKQTQIPENLNNQETTTVKNTTTENTTTESTIPDETYPAIELTNSVEYAKEKGISLCPSLKQSILETVTKEKTEVINCKSISLIYNDRKLY